MMVRRDLHHNRLHAWLRPRSSALISLMVGFSSLLLIGGCLFPSTRSPQPQAEPSPRYSDRAWANVLSRHVTDGLVDYAALARDRAELDRYYALVSVTGPSRTPNQFGSTAAKTAYWINAYNALVLYAVLDRYPVRTMYDLALPRLAYDYTFTVDGRSLNLAAIDAEALASSGGDVRVWLAMSGAAMGTPRLPGEPLRAASLGRQLARIAADALDNPNLLAVDRSSRSILIWQKVLRRQEAYEAFRGSSRPGGRARLFDVISELASAKQREALAGVSDYTFRAIPFDRTLNAMDRHSGSPIIP